MAGHAHGHDHEHEHEHEPAGAHHHHHGHHHHHHGRSRSEAARRALLGTLILNVAFLLLEATTGLITGSLALLSDAAHMVSDVAAIGLALWAAHLVLRPPTPGRTFGLLRAEVLGAFINAVALVVISVFLFKESIARLVSGAPHIDPYPVLSVAAIGLVINLGSAWFLHRSDDSSLNVRGALLHMLADAVSSLGAMISALLTMYFGWTAADAVMGIVIGALVLWSTWGVLRHSTAVLLDFAPPGLGQDVVIHALKGVGGIADVHELHVWTLGSGEPTVTAHLVLEKGAEPAELLVRAECALKEQLGIRHTTLQIDPQGSACAQINCPVLAEV
jgi:cobalt-zinc-cadmium efflux system protein